MEKAFCSNEGTGMRTWRKSHSSVLESERFATLSDGAGCLFFMLVIAQDDTGYYPWEVAKVKRLIVSRSWTVDEVTGFANEIVKSGMADWLDGGISLRRGEELNGKPRRDVTPELYPRQRDVDVTSTLTQRNRNVTSTLEQSRVDKSRAEQSRVLPKGNAQKEVDEEFILTMIEKWGVSEPLVVRQDIEAAMNHVASNKAKNKRLYVDQWLRRNSERGNNGINQSGYGRRNTNGASGSNVTPRSDWQKIAAELAENED